MLKNQEIEVQVPFDVYGDYRIEYQLLRRGGRVMFAWLEEELDKMMRAVFNMSPELKRATKWSG